MMSTRVDQLAGRAFNNVTERRFWDQQLSSLLVRLLGVFLGECQGFFRTLGSRSDCFEARLRPADYRGFGEGEWEGSDGDGD